MQKWEYMFASARFRNDQWRVEQIDGVQRSGWENGQTLRECLNELGGQGWELISQERETVTTKWKYNYVWVHGNWKKLEVTDAQGKKQTYESTEGIFRYINELGNRGWEAVSASAESGNARGDWRGEWLFVFKRSEHDKTIILRLKRPVEQGELP
jgi:hypothetical protein